MIWHSSSAEDVLKHFGVDDKKGLSNGECDEKLQTYGKNVIVKINPPSFLTCFLSQLKNKIVIALIITALISFFLSFVYAEVSSISALLIVAIVVLNALLSAYHIQSCDRTLEDIRQLTNPSVTVLRDGIPKVINAALLVPGDIIILEEGDYIPADARIIDSNEFRCNEVKLTGVEIPVEKNGELILDDITQLESRSNMVFSGCSVAHGNAKAVVTATQLNTEIGKSDAILQQTGEDKLPLQEQLDVIGKMANAAILIVCAVIFLISLIQNFAADNFAAMTVQMLVNAVALAVAAIPEGLPTIAVIVIALGIKRILKDDIIIKNISAVEFFGKTDVLCCDKTGILTRNKMLVSKIYDGDKLCDLFAESPDEKILTVLKVATACSTLQNDSTEDAIEKACLTYNSMSAIDIENIFPKVTTVPFDSARKTMSVITMMNGRPVAIVKGAPESVLQNCKNLKRDEVIKINNDLADEGLRIVCLAMRPLEEIPANPTAEFIENDLIFVGLIALDDPPRDGVIDDIAACQKAGINTVMITGDNLITAKTVARRIGILRDGTLALTGAEMQEMSDDELAANIHKYSVFARVTPGDKLRIVKAWKSRKKCVTITGDNLEDAECLALADVGCALGRYGADAAKGNADIIISNNHFNSLFKAIRESRGLFSNIRKAVSYLFSSNIAEILTVFFGLLFFGNMPIAAVQFLWINLLTDSATAISLSLEDAEDSVMNIRGSATNRIFSMAFSVSILVQSIFIAFITLCAYALGYDFNDTATASTMAFAVLGMAQIFHCFNCKYETTLLNKKIFANSFMNSSALITLFILIFLLFTPAGYVFGLQMLTFSQFIICFALAISVIPAVELFKFIQSKVIKNRAS